jgi:glycosyltransferase involved in cell wall biosynthesis
VKVCFVTANYPPEAIGGTEQVVTALARELRAAGVEVTVLSGSDQPHAGEGVGLEEHEGVPVHRLARRPDEHDRHGFLRPRLLGLVREILQRLRPDVVHVHSFAGLGAGITPICRELGARVAVTFHDLWVVCARFFRVPAGGVTCPTGIDRAPCITCINDALQTDPAFVELGLAERDRLLRAELALADVCTAPSRTAARFVRECLPYGGPIEVVPHGLLRPVPAEHLAPRWRAGETLRVGTFGGLVPEKGVRELVEAVAGLPCELHLTGPFHDQAFEQSIEALAARGGIRLVQRPRFTAAGRHPARDLHLAVFPSKCQETYGLVVDEALAHGVPAVVSDAGALAERAGAGGVVVTAVARLPAVLRELVTSPGRIAELRSSIPAERPTIAASAARHLELYRRLR